LVALVERWQFGGPNSDPIELLKKGNRKMLTWILVMLTAVGFLSTIPLIDAGLSPDATSSSASLMLLFGGVALVLSIVFLWENAVENFRPVRKFIRSIEALDKILLEVGRSGIAPLPQDREDIKKELRDVLVWEARLKLEAEARDKFGEDVKKHEGRFRRLAEAIQNMGFEIEKWHVYYDEATEMLKPKVAKKPVEQKLAVQSL
jgi:hypothetical protein